MGGGGGGEDACFRKDFCIFKVGAYIQEEFTFRVWFLSEFFGISLVR